MTDAHGTPDPHGTSAHAPDHAHAAEALGPIDWRMWGAGALGILAALAVTVAVVIGTGFAFGA